MSYKVRFEVECTIEDEDWDEYAKANRGFPPDDLQIVDIAVKKHLQENSLEVVKIKPCHVELLDTEEDYLENEMDADERWGV